jgi:DNA-binding IclR family transcriptional regulator
VVKRQASRLASLSPTERDLYDAADEQEPFNAEDLCARTGMHDLNSTTKQCLSHLVKLELLKKAGGRKGYLRTPTKVMT